MAISSTLGKSFLGILRDIPQAVKYGLGVSKYKTSAEAEKALKDVESIIKPTLREKRIAAGLTPPQAINPLISAKLGRYTAPRLGLLGAGLYAVPGILSKFTGGTTDTTGQLTPAEYAKMLNYENQQAAEAQLKSLFAPSSNITGLQDYLTKYASGFTPYSAGGAPANTLGTPGSAYVETSSAASPYDTTQAGAVTAGNAYANQIANLTNQLSSGMKTKGGKKSNKNLIDMINSAAAFTAMAEAQQAKQDYRDYMLAQLKATGTNPYLAPSFTGTEQGLGDVYTKWTSMTPEEKNNLAMNGIYSPYDYYVHLRQQNPQSYPGA